MSHYSGTVSGSMSFDSTPVFSTFSVFYTPVISALCTFVSMFSFARSFLLKVKILVPEKIMYAKEHQILSKAEMMYYMAA